MPLLLDTDILSALMKRIPGVTAKAASYVKQHGGFVFSVITRYEILRGLKSVGATHKVAVFDLFCRYSTILPVTNAIVDQAAEIYVNLKSQGRLIGDADILISASALVHGYGVASNNEEHFRRVANLHVENWLK